MDGFALRYDDTLGASEQNPIELKLVGEMFCGDALEGRSELPPGNAMGIATGAPIPPGADAVVIKEKVEVR